MLVVVGGDEKATDKKMFWRRRKRDKKLTKMTLCTKHPPDYPSYPTKPMDWNEPLWIS